MNQKTNHKRTLACPLRQRQTLGTRGRFATAMVPMRTARLLPIAAVSIGLGVGSAVCLESEAVAEPALAESAAAEPVDGVAAALESLASSTTGVVAFMLRAHIALLENRPNAALTAFVGLDATARQQWLEWTEGLGCLTGTAGALPCYLLGDARARVGDLAGALAALDASIRADGDFVLARVARGLLHTFAGDADAAIADLEHALALAPGLAEAHNAMGVLMIQQRIAPAARQAFEAAGQYPQNSLIANNGLGCAHFAEDQWGEADRLFRSVARELELPAVMANAEALAAAAEFRLLSAGARSPMFHPDDFADWDALQRLSQEPRSVIYLFLGSPLPARLDAATVAALNGALGDPGFIDRLEEAGHVSRSRDAWLQQDLVEIHTASGIDAVQEPTEWLATLLVHRRLLEAFYPELIRSHQARGPGMYIGGQVHQYHEQKHISQSVGDYHFQDRSSITGTNTSLNVVGPGGIDSEPADAFTDNGHWPVSPFTGLAYGLSPATDSQRARP